MIEFRREGFDSIRAQEELPLVFCKESLVIK